MSMRLFLYGLWSLFVAAMFMVSGIYAYSPFSDGSRAARGAGGFYGPHHK